MKSGCSGAGDWLPGWWEGEGERGFSKGTLHYMKKNARSDKPFTLNKHVRERVNRWDMDFKLVKI
jgi:hypothetical protein